MANLSYNRIIADMTWSFSRVKSFDDCPHRWFLKYIKRYKDEDMFYASYGKFMHKIIEGFYTKKYTKNEMLTEFLMNFSKEVRGERPSDKIVTKYINDAVEYLKNFKPLPYNMIAVEKEIHFDVDGIPFICFIDYIGEKDGEIYIVDHKSRDLKNRSGRKKPTKKDIELDDMLKQLYIYAIAVKQEYGKYPKKICFNCFRNSELIEEEFDYNVCMSVKEWALEKIKNIEDMVEFYNNENYFTCRYICGVNSHCIREFYDE